MSRSLPDCAPGTGRSCRARNTYHCCNGKMALLPHGFLCNSSNLSEHGVHKCPPFQVSYGTHKNRCKIYIPDPPSLPSWVCWLGPKVLYSPKGFMWLQRFACSHRTRLTLWVKEADFRKHTKNLQRKQVATQSDSSILLLSTRLAPESDFPDLSLHVRVSRARRGNAVGFAHGRRGPGPAPDLLGLLQ